MKIYVIDTNVIVLAGTQVGDVPVDQLNCFEKCISFLNELMTTMGVVLVDDCGMILGEYKNVYSLNTYPSVGIDFFGYLMEHMEYQHIEEVGEYDYAPYPDDSELMQFDKPDRKFISVAYGYKQAIPIVEAIDSKWWGIRELLKKYDIDLVFIDEEYIKDKYTKKMM